MYEIHYCKNFDEIKCLQNYWNELYCNNEELSPFQSYLYNSCLIENKVHKGRLYFAILYKNGIPIIIAPLVKKNRLLYNELRFLGKNTHSDYLNFIYHKNVELKDLEYLVANLLNGSRCTVMKCDLVNQFTLMSRLLERLNVIYFKDKVECIKIPIHKTVEEYHSTLGKSTKKEIKYKQNYLEKNLSNVSFNFIEKKTLDEELISELMNLYSERRKEKNNSIDTRCQEFLENYIRENKDNFLAICRIDGKIAAYNLGYITSSNDICVLVVAIDSNYKKYNIGNILLYDAICYLINRNAHLPEDNGKYKYYDLTRGTELYKYKYGGINYLNHNYYISKSKLLLQIDRFMTKLVIVLNNPSIAINKIENFSKRVWKSVSESSIFHSLLKKGFLHH